MAVGAGETILASDIQAIKDDVDAVLTAATASVSTAESTASTSYTALATTGPAVTITTGTKALVIIEAKMRNDTAGNFCHASCAVSGATTNAANDDRAVTYESGSANDEARLSTARLFTGLTAGSNTFTLQYRVNGGTGTFSLREIIVIPFGD